MSSSGGNLLPSYYLLGVLELSRKPVQLDNLALIQKWFFSVPYFFNDNFLDNLFHLVTLDWMTVVRLQQLLQGNHHKKDKY